MQWQKGTRQTRPPFPHKDLAGPDMKETSPKDEEKEQRLAQYARNLIEAMQEMPQNSPIRCGIVQMCAGNIRVKDIANDFHVTPKCVYVAMAVENNFAQSMKSRINVKRKRVEDVDDELARQFLDDACPIPSGRDYRLVRMTYDNMYAMYVAYCNDRNAGPLGKTYFIEKVLLSTKVRHSTDESICKLCDGKKKWEKPFPLNAKDQKKWNEYVEHQLIWHEQGRYYLEKKNELVYQMREEIVMVLQDFTQLLVQGTFFQDLIIVLYMYSPHAAGNLKREYHHFIAPTSDTSNDGNFVVRCWKYMIDNDWFDDFTMIRILSDGGGKHFKTTAIMNFFGVVQMATEKTVEYNFFESYHGHSVCDAAAAHAKNALNVHQRDNDDPINTPPQIVTIINQVENHKARVAPTRKTDSLPGFATMHGITSMHQFTFNHDTISGSRLSRLHTNDITFFMTKTQYFVDLLAGE